VLMLVCLLSGCASNHTLVLRFSEQIRHFERPADRSSERSGYTVTKGSEGDFRESAVPTMTPVPWDVVAISASVSKLDVARSETLSVATEESRAVFRLPQGASVPEHPEVTTIILRYNDLLLGHPFHVGQVTRFRFTSDGSFFDIDGLARVY